MTDAAGLRRERAANMTMARLLPRPIAHIRRLLLALLAVGLALHMGVGCAAMAATPQASAAHQSHCADMTGKPAKPMKAGVTTCGFCAALPDTTRIAPAPLALAEQAPVTMTSLGMAGLAGGPAPPPPRSA